MDKEKYKQRLISFNNTPKYRSEVDFLCRLITPSPNEKILDYGCGLGRTVYHINETSKANCFGYDVSNYRENDDQYLFRSEYFFKFQKVFFMHSIAHIPEIDQKLQVLKDLLHDEAKIYVITPNKLWLKELMWRGDYIPDPTVINHFSAQELEELFYKNGYQVVNSGLLGSVLNNQHERVFLEATI